MAVCRGKRTREGKVVVDGGPGKGGGGCVMVWRGR